MAFADTQKLVVELDLKGNLQSGLAKATSSVKGFDKATSNTQKSLSKFGSNIGKTFAIGAAAATAGAFAVVRAASDYEDAFAGIRKTVDETANTSFADLSQAVRDLAKEIPISAAELARLGEAGGALGVPTDNLEEFIRVTALLGQTTDLTADEAANSLGILTNVLHLTDKEYQQFASSLVALGNAGASTESQIIAIAERAGAAGELVGLTTEQVLALSSSVASLGIEAEAGGSALQKFFIDSTKHIAEGGDELALFAKVSGTSTKAFKKQFDKDAGGALTRFLAGLGKLGQSQQLQVLEDLGFNDVRITRTLLGLANNTELVSSQMEIANRAFKENTALTEEARKRNETFASQLQITKNVLTDIAITVGSKLLPKITPLLQRFNEFVNQNQGGIEKFGTDLANAFERFADAVGKTDWTPFIDGLKLSASLAKGAFDAFNALPDDFKKLVLVGFGINKFTGGLITSLGKDLAGAFGSVVFDKFLARGSSPANPLWVQSVGAPGTGTGAAGGKGGVLGSAGAILGGATVALAAQEGAKAGILAATGSQAAAMAQSSVGGGPTNILGPLDRLFRALQGDFRSDFEVIQDLERQQLAQAATQSAAEQAALRANAQSMVAASERADQQRAAQTAAITAKIGAGTSETARTRMAVDANRAATERVRAATEQARAGITAKIGAGTAESARIRQAIAAKNFSPTIRVGVSIRNVVSAQNQLKTIYRTQS